MTVLVLPLIFVFTALTVLVFAVGARRLLGLRFSFLRTLIAGVLAFLIASPIITAISGSVVTKRTSVLPELWFVILGVTIALVVGMVFLVVAEALVPSGSVPGPLYVLRGMRRRMGRARRYWQISRILVRRGLMPYVRGGRRSELATPEGRARLARSVRLAMEDGGVTFVKLGQVLSTRRDLLPAEFISELSRLQDDAAEVPWPRIEQVLRSELGAEVGELFASFDREPIAAASIAQVHAATLPSGARVVVKVRRPDVSQIVDRDLDIAGRLAARLERSTSWGRAVGTAGLAAGFAGALREELDLRVEARNMTSVAAAPGSRGSGSIAIPVPYQPLCTGLVLVMERFDGRPLAAIDAGMPADVRAALARSLLDSGTDAGPVPGPARRSRDHPRRDDVHRPVPHRLRPRAGGTTGDSRGIPRAGHDGGHAYPARPGLRHRGRSPPVRRPAACRAVQAGHAAHDRGRRAGRAAAPAAPPPEAHRPDRRSARSRTAQRQRPPPRR